MWEAKDLNFDWKKAVEVQQRLASRLVIENDVGKVIYIAGADFSYHKPKKLIGAIVVVQKFPELETVEIVEDVREVRIPYVPGFLNFREGVPFMRAFQKLKIKPDVTLVDGNGIAHPRKMGLASYVGVVLDIPTVGCAKSSFFPFKPPVEQRGAFSHYKDHKNDWVGFCLRTRKAVKPVFVSPGHRVNFEFSRRIVLSCSRYRIPEPIRIAHQKARELFSGRRF
jgi:deoxyribonuclease V